MKKLIILGLLLCNFQSAYATLRVTPTIIELNANKTKRNYITASFNVRGADNETIRFKVYPSYFEITEDGKMNEISVSNSPNSLVKNVGIVPNEFTLMNGTPQKVRLTIANIDKLPDGENRMVLFLEDVKAKEVLLPNNNSDVVTKLIVKSRVGIPVYLDKGRFVKCANLEDLSIQKDKNDLNLKLHLISKGNSKVRYHGKAQIIQNKKLVKEFPISSHTIKNNGNLYVTEKIPVSDISENGEYKLRVIVTYEDERGNLKNITRETNFMVEKIEDTKM